MADGLKYCELLGCLPMRSMGVVVDHAQGPVVEVMIGMHLWPTLPNVARSYVDLVTIRRRIPEPVMELLRCDGGWVVRRLRLFDGWQAIWASVMLLLPR